MAHIAEVARRNLFLKEGFSCLFKYCQLRLGLSESESFHRMTAAAIARKYPVVFSLIEQRKIHLSGLCKLRDFLTRANHEELLREACGKTKQQVEELLAARFPARRVKDSMRRLPSGRVLPVAAPPEHSMSTALPSTALPSTTLPSTAFPSTAGTVSLDQVTRTRIERTESTLAFGDAERRVPSSAGVPVDVVDPTTGEVTTVVLQGEVAMDVAQNDGGDAQPAQPSRSSRSRSSDAKSEHALTPQPRYRVQFDASCALKEKIALAAALDSHANPKGELAVLFERALDLYVEHLQKKRFGKTDKPRRTAPESMEKHVRHLALRSRSFRSAAEGKTTEVEEPSERSPSERSASERSASERSASERSASERSASERSASERSASERSPSRRKHLSHETRRAVVEKDGLRCAFVSATGQRCDEQAFLQFHHEAPWARTKDDRPGNLHLFCDAHNRFQAEQDFGAKHVARRIAVARGRRARADVNDE